MEKYGIVYLWFDRKHKRYYVGSHWGTENDGYVCSSSWMNSAFKRRPTDFKRRILKYVYSSRNDLLDEEYKYLSLIKENELSIRYYNLRIIRSGHWTADENKKLTVGQKIAKSRSGKTYGKRGPASEETKDKIRQKLKGRTVPPEIAAKGAATRLGKKRGKYKKDTI